MGTDGWRRFPIITKCCERTASSSFLSAAHRSLASSISCCTCLICVTVSDCQRVEKWEGKGQKGNYMCGCWNTFRDTAQIHRTLQTGDFLWCKFFASKIFMLNNFCRIEPPMEIYFLKLFTVEIICEIDFCSFTRVWKCFLMMKFPDWWRYYWYIDVLQDWSTSSKARIFKEKNWTKTIPTFFLSLLLPKRHSAQHRK